MKFKDVLSLGICVILTIVFCTYIGHLLDMVLLGIIVGFILAFGYVAYLVFKHD